MTYKKSTETITPAIQKKGGDDLNYEFTYQYDADYAHRLTRVGSEKKGWRYYTYDANGNVTSESDGVAPNEDTTTLTPVTVTTQTNEEGSPVYEADYAWAWPWSGNTGGNKPTPNNKRTYEWNSRNLLMRSVNPVYDTRYVYAADGNRAAKWTATKSSETLYFNTMWTWHTDTGLPEGQYSKHIYLGETRVVTKQTSKLEVSYGQSDEWHHRYYYHPDHLGSAQLVTDYEGNEYQRIEYTPYGELWVEKKTEKEEGLRYLPYKFTAKEQDEETGLYYYGARYLDSKYSRWLSADPAVSDYVPQAPVNDEARKHNQNLPGMGGIFNHINCNLYHYAGNNPVRYIDPDGNFLLDSKSAKEYAQKNSSGIAATYGQAYILSNFRNTVYPMPINAVKANSPFFAPYTFQFSDVKNLQTALTSIEKNKDSVFVSYDIQVNAIRINKDVYQIDISVVGYMTDPQSGERNIFASGSGTVGYAHIQEIQGFNGIDDKKIKDIVNKALDTADFTLKMGDKE